MKLATHNTMTYLPPKKWWGKILGFIAKCQSVDYKKQHELGAEGYDLRLFFDKDGNVEYRHGIISYDASNIYDVLNYARDNNIIVRVLLEIRTYNKNLIEDTTVNKLKQYFIDFCNGLENQYPTIKFYGGKSLMDMSVVLYDFKNKPVIKEFGLFSSMTSLFKSDNKFLRIIDDLWPWLYARLNNKKNIEKHKDKSDEYYMSIDFINIQ